MDKQVSQSHYSSERYAFSGRWVSYYHQVKESLALSPKSILEIGVGDKVFGSYLKANTEISYTALDIAEDLKPDILGSVTDIPCPDNSFDVVCAFQILEHLPFSEFDKACSEIARVSKIGALISLPHFGPPVKFSFKLPFLRGVYFAWKIPFPKKHTFNGQHHWEIGKKGYSAQKIRDVLSRYFLIEKEFIPFENQYHRFYVLKKVKSDGVGVLSSPE